MELINKEILKNKKVIPVSEELRIFLIEELMYRKDEDELIYEEDIDRLIEYIKEVNEIRTNKIVIPCEIAVEFIELVKEKIKKKNVELGNLIIDISGKDFSIKDFVSKTKKMSYILQFKITSINDLKEEELDFLNSRYGIIYTYTDNEYHIDDLLKIVSNMKELIKTNEKHIKSSEKNLERAIAIANIIFKNFDLYIPREYPNPYKDLVLENGEKADIPTIRFLEDTSKYAELTNIFKVKTADYTGMKKLYKECLRYDGYKMVERVATIRNSIDTEFVIGDKKYGIDVTNTGINLVSIK